MPIVEPELAPLHIPRLADLATSAWAAWLWSADASQILWANAVGAAIFGAASATACRELRFGGKDPSAAQILRLAASLPSAGQERLERLRGFGAGVGGALVCACSRIVQPDGAVAILVAANEPAGPALPLRERVRRLFGDSASALAAFAPDGALIHAGPAALQALGGATTLSALGMEALAAKALEAGSASGAARLGPTQVEVAARRLGKDGSRIVVVALPSPTSERAAQQPAQDTSAPAQAASAPEAQTPPARLTAALDDPVGERRHPLRFVWQMDADGRFVIGSDEFIELVGPRTTAACGRAWRDIASELNLDPDNHVARALATRETWSNILVLWPVDESSDRLPVELSGLPVFDRDRTFLGYRGFGVCRDVARIDQLARTRRARPTAHAPMGLMPAAGTPHGDERGSAAVPQTVAAAAISAAAASPYPTEASETPLPGAATAAATSPDARVASGGAPASANVVPFRATQAPETKPPSLSPVEHNAFRELAQELNARLRGGQGEPAAVESVFGGQPAEEQLAAAVAQAPTAEAPSGDITPGDVAAQATPHVAADLPPTAIDAPSVDQPQTEKPPAAAQVLLDRVPAGVLVYRNDKLIYANRHFFETSGYDSLDALAAAGGLNALFVEPGTGALADSGDTQKLTIMPRSGDKLPVEGRLFTVPWNGGSALALVLTSGQAEERQRQTQRALGAAENEIRELKSNLERAARREAQKAAAAKADFLAKVSHEIRTPLNSMIGFAEVIMAERFGAIGNERYREYLKDMHAAGTHLVSLLNDLLDLSKIETGQLDLNFVDVDLNELTQQCVAIMQPQANRARIIIRSALAPGLPKVVADERSLRQIVFNLLAHAIRFTAPGGQVIISTVMSDGGAAALRVRDTGVGMRERDIEAALEPFRQNATSASWGSGGTGLGLPLTKALAEANRANFSIKSAPNAGTLIEIAFPPSRALTQ